MNRAIMLSITVLAGCAATLTPQAFARLGSDPVLSGGSYDSGGGITVAVDLRENAGRTMVCGTWAQSRHQSVLTLRRADKVLGTGAVYLDGHALVRGLTFMPETEPLGSYAGAEAGCVVTDRPWRASDEARRPVVRIPGQIVYVDGSEAGHMIVRYVHDGPGAQR